MSNEDNPFMLPGNPDTRMLVSSNLTAATCTLIASGMEQEKAAETAMHLFGSIDSFIRESIEQAEEEG